MISAAAGAVRVGRFGRRTPAIFIQHAISSPLPDVDCYNSRRFASGADEARPRRRRRRGGRRSAGNISNRAQSEIEDGSNEAGPSTRRIFGVVSNLHANESTLNQQFDMSALSQYWTKESSPASEHSQMMAVWKGLQTGHSVPATERRSRAGRRDTKAVKQIAVQSDIGSLESAMEGSIAMDESLLIETDCLAEQVEASANLGPPSALEPSMETSSLAVTTKRRSRTGRRKSRSASQTAAEIDTKTSSPPAATIQTAAESDTESLEGSAEGDSAANEPSINKAEDLTALVDRPPAKAADDAINLDALAASKTDLEAISVIDVDTDVEKGPEKKEKIQKAIEVPRPQSRPWWMSSSA